MNTVSRGLFIWELIKSFKTFLKTFRFAVTDYREFFSLAFKMLGVSPAGSQNPPETNAGEFEYLKPLPFLGIAIGIAALVHPLDQLTLLDLARHHPGLSGEFVELLEHLSSTTMAERAKSSGTTLIDFAGLFGVPVLDGAVGKLVQYLAYLVFGLLVSRFSRGAADAKAMAYSFTYLVGIVLTVQTAVRIVFMLLYWTLFSNDAAFNLQAMMVVDFLTSAGLGLYILLMPVLILSATMGADRKAVLRGVIIALVVWLIATICLELILESEGIYLLNYGLNLSSL